MKNLALLTIVLFLLLLSCTQTDNAIQDITTQEEKEIINIGGSSSYMGYNSWEEIISEGKYIIKCEITEKLPVTLIGGYTLQDLKDATEQKNISDIPNHSLLSIRTPYTASITDIYYAIDDIPNEIQIYQPYGEFENYVFTYEDVVPLKEGSSYILILGKVYDGDTPIYYLSSIIQGFAEIVTYNEKTSELTLSTSIHNDLFDDISSLEQLKNNIDTAAMALD